MDFLTYNLAKHLFYPAHTVYLRADDSQCGGISGKDGVQSLSLLGRVVGIGITHLPLLMLRLCETSPSPEVTAGELTSALRIVSNQ